MIGMINTTIQAPAANLVIRMMTSTTSERKDPNPLTKNPFRQPGSLWVRWCLAMPAWLMVKLVNTPMAYSGMRRSTLASVASMTTAATTAREMMPLENTSRWPRLVSCFGMKLSPAWKLASRGKSAKLVLAARTRISMVPAWSR